MKRFEIIGPSGVGKTTLYRHICDTPKSDRPYYTINEAKRLAAIRHNIPKSDLWLLTCQLLLKFRLLPQKVQGLSNTILKNSNVKNSMVELTDYQKFHTSFMSLYLYLGGEANPYVIYHKIRKMMECIDDYLVLEELLPVDMTVLYDEGMIHRLENITEHFFDRYSLEHCKKDVLLNPAGIIYCRQNTDLIYQQALERKIKGIYTFSHSQLSDKELLAFIEDDMIMHENKINLFAEMGVPLLNVNTGDDPSVNIDKINGFIGSLDDAEALT